MTTTRKERKVETRRSLLEQAAKLFAEQGYEGTTTRQIAQCCEVSIGTVFAHFPNKQALLQAVLYDGVERALETARRKLDSDASVAEAMAAFAASLYRYYLQRRELSQELLKHSLFDAQEFAGQLLLFRNELMSHIKESNSSDLNKEDVVDALLSHYFFVLLTLLNQPGMSVQRAVKRLRRMNALVIPLEPGR